MPWTIDDHEASAREAIERGVISGRLEHLAAIPEPQQSSEHQARVSSLSVLNELGGPARTIAVPWSASPPAPVEPPIEPPVVEPSPEPEYDLIIDTATADPAGKVTAAGTNANIKFMPGVYDNLEIIALDGQHLYGVGAVLDGPGVRYAFAGAASGDTYQGFEVRNYQNPNQQGAFNLRGGADRTVDGCEVHHNLGTGIKFFADRVTITNCNVHHQHQLGIGGGGKDCLVVDTEIAFNNWLAEVSWGWEAGGTKFWSNDGLIVRGCHSHDNHGPGLWTDHDNINVLYEDNLVEDNYANGIFHEISYKATIRNNTTRRNGFGHDAWLWGAGILIAASQDVEAYGNVVEGNYNGITILQQDRFNGALNEPYLARNNLIRDNTIIESGITGAAQDISDTAIYHANNTYRGNIYQDENRWKWEDGYLTWAEWVAIHPGDAV